MKMAKPGATLDMTEPPSEAFDRREVVVLTGETVGHSEQRLPPIIRTDAGGFFGLGEHDGPKRGVTGASYAKTLPRCVFRTCEIETPERTGPTTVRPD
jgi:hypothetical protein